MFLMSVLLSAITFAPAMAPRDTGSIGGYVQGDVISPDKTCKPGDICAKASMPSPRNGCFFNNFWNSTKGGTPLTIDVTETGKSGSPVYIYWVNATNIAIAITGKAYANFYCPRL
ncbi:MAG: hypothetical protein JO113_05380 [Candidatus Eremiobacteraeota bacterium]|nr:hypothetical protein [Candidatus Eremiobacteraeota bacterium]